MGAQRDFAQQGQIVPVEHAGETKLGQALGESVLEAISGQSGKVIQKLLAAVFHKRKLPTGLWLLFD